MLSRREERFARADVSSSREDWMWRTTRELAVPVLAPTGVKSTPSSRLWATPRQANIGAAASAKCSTGCVTLPEGPAIGISQRIGHDGTRLIPQR